MILRPVYILGSIFLAFSIATLLTHSRMNTPLVHANAGQPASFAPGDAAGWFQAMKPYCNAVEVEAWHKWSPPPAGEQGAGFSAACYALAGKIDQARAIIKTVPQDAQWKAAGIVFNVGHPVADAGDDESAGPIMELVVEFWPNHYMALYHAGIALYELGDNEAARVHLQDFLKYYDIDDGWRRNALSVLGELAEN